jgi:CRP-like cAMP-binding protein
MLGPGEFFGEGCLADQPVRLQSATATAKSTILFLEKDQMVRLVHEQPAIRNRFIAHVLERSIRFEENLVDQLLNGSEQRLARTLLRLARNRSAGEPVRTLPSISQETLAEMVGTTRSRVNVFMRKFQRLGFVDCSAGLKIDSARLAAVLQD